MLRAAHRLAVASQLRIVRRVVLTRTCSLALGRPVSNVECTLRPVRLIAAPFAAGVLLLILILPDRRADRMRVRFPGGAGHARVRLGDGVGLIRRHRARAAAQPVRAPLAAEHQHHDDLPRGLGPTDPLLDRAPQCVDQPDDAPRSRSQIRSPPSSTCGTSRRSARGACKRGKEVVEDGSESRRSRCYLGACLPRKRGRRRVEAGCPRHGKRRSRHRLVPREIGGHHRSASVRKVQNTRFACLTRRISLRRHLRVHEHERAVIGSSFSTERALGRLGIGRSHVGDCERPAHAAPAHASRWRRASGGAA